MSVSTGEAANGSRWRGRTQRNKLVRKKLPILQLTSSESPAKLLMTG